MSDPLESPEERTRAEELCLRAFGLLTADQERELERALSEDPALRAEADELAATAAAMAELSAPTSPGRDLLPALLERVRTEVTSGDPTPPWQRWSEERGDSPQDELQVVRAAGDGRQPAASDWEPTGRQGVSARRLSVDASTDRVTMLVRMEAGTSWPAHVHADSEECYVLQGDLCVGDVSMHAGDYQRVPAGSTHPVQTTEGGCLLFISGSRSDRVIAS